MHCSYEVLSLVDQSKYGNGPLLYYLFNTLLISLLVLHIYWWILIYRMILRQIQARGNIEKDVRSGMCTGREGWLLRLAVKR